MFKNFIKLLTVSLLITSGTHVSAMTPQEMILEGVVILNNQLQQTTDIIEKATQSTLDTIATYCKEGIEEDRIYANIHQLFNTELFDSPINTDKLITEIIRIGYENTEDTTLTGLINTLKILNPNVLAIVPAHLRAAAPMPIHQGNMISRHPYIAVVVSTILAGVLYNFLTTSSASEVPEQPSEQTSSDVAIYKHPAIPVYPATLKFVFQMPSLDKVDFETYFENEEDECPDGNCLTVLIEPRK